MASHLLCHCSGASWVGGICILRLAPGRLHSCNRCDRHRFDSDDIQRRYIDSLKTRLIKNQKALRYIPVIGLPSLLHLCMCPRLQVSPRCSRRGMRLYSHENGCPTDIAEVLSRGRIWAFRGLSGRLLTCPKFSTGLIGRHDKAKLANRGNS